MEITIGRVVFYTLSEQDAAEINRRRTNSGDIADRIKKNTAESSAWPIGAQAHIGNMVNAGDVFPMDVVRVWSPGIVNGQVKLDGNDVLWVTSVEEGTAPRHWHWPPRI